MELAEVYRVQYQGRDDILRGIIVCKDSETGYQCLFKDQGLEDEVINNTLLMLNNDDNNPDCAHLCLQQRSKQTSHVPIKSLDHIIPNSCITSSIRAKDGFLVGFYLFDFTYEKLTFEYPYHDPEKFSVPLRKSFVSEDGFRHFNILYAIFNNAVEACLKVTLTNCVNPFVLCGVIAARTSAIERPAYSSIIFNEECGIFIELGSGGDIVIPLLRDIVAVPLGHQLILEINLSGKDNDGKKDSDKMVEDYLVFDAIDDGKSTKSISGSKGELRVEVSWRSREKSH
ncbi:hypothetical protein ACET3Z_004582 [Daucus carota]